MGISRLVRSPLGAVIAVLILVAVVANNNGGSEKGGGPRPHAGRTSRTPMHSADSGTFARGVAVPVVRGVDGDTFLVHYEGRDQYVRMIGIDTPETVKPGTPVQCFGERASHFTTDEVTGRTVHLVFGAERHDVYGRLLAYVYIGGDFLNADLVRRGFARTLTIAPNTEHESLFARLAGHAGSAGRGLWGAC